MDFRGASAEAVAALTEELKGAVEGSPAADTGSALFAVATTLRSEPALRRFLADTTIDPGAKTGLVKEVFGPKLDAISLDLLTKAATRRWTHSTDLSDGIERLSEAAVVLSAGDDAGRLSDELFELRRVVDEHPELRDALSDPARSAEDKSALVAGLLEGKALPATIELAQHALAGTYGTVSAALGAYRTLAGEVRGQSVATVHVARPLSAEQLTRLTDGLARQYGRKVHANVEVDPSLLGGIRVEIGDDVIDGSIASRLDDASRRLAG